MDFDPDALDPALRHNPIKAMVAPRPIGWLSTLSPDGAVNLAPYSFFNLVCDAPYMVMFATSGHKDSFNNVRATGEFVWNLVSEDLCEAMNTSAGSAAPGADEFELAGLEKAASRCVAPPRVARARAALECQLDQIVDLKSDDPTRRNSLVIGTVRSVFIADGAIVDGRFDAAGVRQLARLGYRDYAVIEKIFELQRPS
ncbi:MAG: flavin reductase family protein [Alphaproteobacteria bacterium]|nr:flavin reductase family protein [Alphaproteobacteria bacterium]